MAQVSPILTSPHGEAQAALHSAAGNDEVRTLVGIARPVPVGKRIVVYARLVEESGTDERGGKHLLVMDMSSPAFVIAIAKAQVDANKAVIDSWVPGDVLEMRGVMMGVASGANKYDPHYKFMKDKVVGNAYGRLLADGKVSALSVPCSAQWHVCKLAADDSHACGMQIRVLLDVESKALNPAVPAIVPLNTIETLRTMTAGGTATTFALYGQVSAIADGRFGGPAITVQSDGLSRTINTFPENVLPKVSVGDDVLFTNMTAKVVSSQTYANTTRWTYVYTGSKVQAVVTAFSATLPSKLSDVRVGRVIDRSAAVSIDKAVQQGGGTVKFTIVAANGEPKVLLVKTCKGCAGSVHGSDRLKADPCNVDPAPPCDACGTKGRVTFVQELLVTQDGDEAMTVVSVWADTFLTAIGKTSGEFQSGFSVGCSLFDIQRESEVIVQAALETAFGSNVLGAHITSGSRHGDAPRLQGSIDRWDKTETAVKDQADDFAGGGAGGASAPEAAAVHSAHPTPARVRGGKRAAADDPPSDAKRGRAPLL